MKYYYTKQYKISDVIEIIKYIYKYIFYFVESIMSNDWNTF